MHCTNSLLYSQEPTLNLFQFLNLFQISFFYSHPPTSIPPLSSSFSPLPSLFSTPHLSSLSLLLPFFNVSSWNLREVVKMGKSVMLWKRRKERLATGRKWLSIKEWFKGIMSLVKPGGTRGWRLYWKLPLYNKDILFNIECFLRGEMTSEDYSTHSKLLWNCNCRKIT